MQISLEANRKSCMELRFNLFMKKKLPLLLLFLLFSTQVGVGLVTKLCLTLAIPWTVACQAPLCPWDYPGKLMKWVVISSSRGSSRTREQTQVSCVAGGLLHIGSVQFSHSVVSDFVTPWTTARQASLSITNSRSLPKLMSIESVMPSILPSVVPFSSCLQSFPVSGSFQMSEVQLFSCGNYFG